LADVPIKKLNLEQMKGRIGQIWKPAPFSPTILVKTGKIRLRHQTLAK
jgi:hypothetical protein